MRRDERGVTSDEARALVARLCEGGSISWDEIDPLAFRALVLAVDDPDAACVFLRAYTRGAAAEGVAVTLPPPRVRAEIYLATARRMSDETFDRVWTRALTGFRLSQRRCPHAAPRETRAPGSTHCPDCGCVWIDAEPAQARPKENTP